MNRRWMRACLMGLFSIIDPGFIGCGGDAGNGGGEGHPTPVDHMLAEAMPVTFDAGSFYGFEFILPAAATVPFSAGETTTDTWNVALFTPAEWTSWQNGTGNQAIGAPHNNVSQVSDSALLPAGDYYLGFHCDNLLERCMITFNIDAIY